MIGRNELYNTIIVAETQDSQIPTNNKQENGQTNGSLYFTARVPPNRNQGSA